MLFNTLTEQLIHSCARDHFYWRMARRGNDTFTDKMGWERGRKWEVAAFGAVINGRGWLVQLKSSFYIQMFPM
jgi:hypothetical protein